jgi:oligopeptidase A
VRFFEVRAANGSTLSYFYVDPYSRPSEKRSGAWMDSVRSRSKLLAPPGARVRLPVALAITNQMAPVGDAPGLMTFREARGRQGGHALRRVTPPWLWLCAVGLALCPSRPFNPLLHPHPPG